jgi:hypothetical protein
VGELISAGEVERVSPDLAIARRMLEDAGRHLATASRAKVAGDLSGAYQLAYDALRKSAASLLEAQGLRATSRGGHLAVQEVVVAQFGTTVRIFRSFGRIRRARTNFEYPSSSSPGPTIDDIDDAIAIATQACEAATTILDQNMLTRW